MNWLRQLSLKVKLLILMVTLTSTMLVVYAGLALRDFRSDKEAYVYDSLLSQSKSIAIQIRSEIEFVADQIRFYMGGYSFPEDKFHPYKAYLLPADPLMESLTTFKWNREKSSYVQASVIKQNTLSPEMILRLSERSSKLIQDALEAELSLREFDSVTGRWLVGLRYKVVGEEHPLVVVALVKRGTFLESFSGFNNQDTYLINHNGEVLFRPSQASYFKDDEELRRALGVTVEKLVAPAVTHEFNTADGDAWLISAAKVNAGNMKVVSYVPKSVALEAAQLLVIKSGLFLGVLLCLTVFIGVVTSNTLTGALKRLFQATLEIGKGNFSVEVKVKSEDEIGVVARGFNQMTKEIQRLLAETAEKARMESELQTASLVQSTLFPEPEYKGERVEVKGFYQPASECGGDWWYYSHVHNRTFFWIGDATGHGVPAALVTSAARSAMGVIENFPELPLPQIMEMMNKSICGAAKGQVLMTFFVACLDHRTGKFSYSNASHDPPFLIRGVQGQIKKKDLQVLMENRGARFGESLDSRYTHTEIQLQKGDRLLFYTDGVTELHNEKGELWGEREFIRAVLEGCNKSVDLDQPMQALGSRIAEFRQSAALKDDVTYFMAQYKPAA